MSRRNPMPEFADAPIKLFGRSIQLPDSNSPQSAAAAADSAELDASSSAETADGYADTGTKELDNGTAAESLTENGKSPEKFQEHEDMEDTDVKTREQQVTKNDADSDEKVLKKPDKVLPCPRCHSMETKFCYFNNYNVNQPRHFCKSCQRYWTAGGTIRNVPVGAGRRKNKQIGSQFQSLVMSPNGGPVTHMNLLNSADPSGVSSGLCSPTGFAIETKDACQNGNDPPLCNSVATLLTLNDHSKPMENSGNACREGIALPSVSVSTQNVFPKEVAQVGQVGSSGSHIAPLPSLQGYTGPPNYPWNIGWTAGMAYNADGGHTVLVPWSFPPMATVPKFCSPTPGVFPLVPPPYWNWDAGAWNLQSNNLSPSSSAGNSSCSGNTSPLGKHSRDLNSQAEEATEKCLWVPKTLRIDDPDEAAKSSIWTTLGIKPDDRAPFSKCKPLKELLRKSDCDVPASEGEQTLQANPAAHSRFKAFQESS
ncbi:hypothetical protein V2J09_013552 [Rumex salicifolius]